MDSGQKTSKKLRTKMYLALVCVIVAFVVLGGATYAWFTLSTNPEIEGITANLDGSQAVQVSLNNSDYNVSQQIKLDSFAPLIPASTIDGLNWFVAKYDAKGDVLQEAKESAYLGTQYMYLRFPDGGNVSKNATIPVKKTLGNTSNTIASYYIYTDIYVKTEYKKTDVYLALPSAATTSVEDYKEDAQETEKNHYGTYVLSYSYDSEAKLIKLLCNGVDTSVRVGFMILGQVEDGEHLEDGQVLDPEPLNITHPEYFYVTSNQVTQDDPKTEIDEKNSNEFFIYEPNADSRSYADKTDEKYNTDMYIVGFEARTFYTTEGSNLTYSEANGYYIQTYPVALTTATAAKINSMLDKTAAGCAPLYNEWLITGQDIGGGNKADGILATFPVSKLIVQKTSTWKEGIDPLTQIETESTTEPDPEEEPGPETETETTTRITPLDQMFNSTEVGVMGAFLDTSDPTVLKYRDIPGSTLNVDYTAVKVMDIAQQARSTPKLVTLEKNKPVKIRMYFWIEGQDVDCWNDISISSFLVNLEFVGDVIERE